MNEENLLREKWRKKNAEKEKERIERRKERECVCMNEWTERN